jgi:dipeptidyl aminopeptidase/acylaminoacyl peptidase
MSRPLAVLFAFAFLTTPAHSQEVTPWTVDDVVLAEHAGGFQIAPDGRCVVWAKVTADTEKGGYVSNLVRSGLTENQSVELTRGNDNCFAPRWSPNGQLIAFLTSRGQSGSKDEPQLWLMNPFGGEPWRLTESQRGIDPFEWANDQTIVFAAKEAASLYENTKKKEQKDTTIIVEDELHAAPVRLFQVAVASRKVTRLTDNTDRIESFALAPNGRYAVTIHERSLRYTYDHRVKPAVFLYDLSTGARQRLFSNPKFNVTQVRWTPDSTGFYAASEFTHHPLYLNASITELYYCDLPTTQTWQVNLDWDKGLSHSIEMTPEGSVAVPAFRVTPHSFVALLADGARNKATRFIRHGQSWQRQWLEGEHADHLYGLQESKDGHTLVYAHSTASAPTRWYHARLEGDRLLAPQLIAGQPTAFTGKTLARTEVVRWKGAGDEEVEGVLYYPHHYQSGKRYPLIAMIHGGPAGAVLDAWSESWMFPANLLNQRGAFVLKPNYHGSSNYGLKWVESIAGGKYYDLEVPDIEAGVDALIARGLVDPDKLGVMGWSNGGILTTALTVATHRYKAASAGAGDVEWSSDWGTCRFGASFDNYYLGRSPLEDPLLYVRKSPFYRLDQVTTPTLICFGTEDTTTPSQQGWMHYRALQQLGKTPVRFVLFPGEEHILEKIAHQRRKLEEEMGWFDKYLFHKAKEGNEALKPESPLARLVQRQHFQRDGRRYGVLEKGILVPETVRCEKLHVGRFEITRAQYAQFDRSYPLELGQENYPANNIPFDKAKAYCTWLSERTGRKYRLPSEQDAQALYDQRSSAENTLDYWAGYAVNPDDARRLQPELRGLGSGAPLLKEVGSFPGSAKGETVFDLGGNVAEWVVRKDGTGQPRGASADTPATASPREQIAAPEYIGFRVVLDQTRP